MVVGDIEPALTLPAKSGHITKDNAVTKANSPLHECSPFLPFTCTDSHKSIDKAEHSAARQSALCFLSVLFLLPVLYSHSVYESVGQMFTRTNCLLLKPRSWLLQSSCSQYFSLVAMPLSSMRLIPLIVLIGAVINATQVTYLLFPLSALFLLFSSNEIPSPATVNVVEDPALCAVVLTLISGIIIVASLPFSLFFCIKVSSTTNVLCSLLFYSNDAGMV